MTPDELAAIEANLLGMTPYGVEEVVHKALAEVRRCWALLYPHDPWAVGFTGTGDAAIVRCAYCGVGMPRSDAYCAARHAKALEAAR